MRKDVMVVQYLRDLVKKGDPIPVMGLSASGKSSLIAKLSKIRAIFRILTRRLADGKGTLKDTKIVVTNYKEVPEDVVIVYGKAPQRNLMDGIYDGAKLIGWTLFMAIKEYEKRVLEQESVKLEKFANDVICYFNEKIDEKDNSSLAFKLKDMTQEQIKDILDLFTKPEVIQQLYIAYIEIMTETNKGKGTDAKVSLFTDLLLQKVNLSSDLNEAMRYFWDNITVYINNKICEIVKDIDEYNRVKGYSFDVTFCEEFEMVIREEDLNTPIVQAILDGKNKAYELYIEDLTFVFRNDELLTKDYYDIFSVMEINGETIKSFCLVDTMGLFHQQGTTAESESDNIIKKLKKYHSDKIIFTSNALGDSGVKDGISAIAKFYRHAKKPIKSYFIFTHYDMLLLNQKKRCIEEGFDLNYFENDANEYLADFMEDIEIALDSNTNKSKPLSPVFLVCGKECGDAGAKHSIDDIITKGNSYNAVIDHIVNDIVSTTNKNVYKIGDRQDFTCYFKYGIEKYDFSDVVLNLLDCYHDCEISASIHPAWKTVEAILNHWSNEGMHFESNAQGYDSGYAPTSSYFIKYIKTFINNYIIEKMEINTANLKLLSQKQKEDFEKDVKSYLLTELGGEFAKVLYKETNMFLNKGTVSHYTYLYEVLSVLLRNYFQVKHMPINTLIMNTLEKAKNKCLDEFVHHSCIQVY